MGVGLFVVWSVMVILCCGLLPSISYARAFIQGRVHDTKTDVVNDTMIHSTPGHPMSIGRHSCLPGNANMSTFNESVLMQLGDLLEVL